MPSLRDYLTARAAISRGMISKTEALQVLKAQAANPSPTSWLDLQLGAGRINPQQAGGLRSEVDRFEALRAEDAYAKAARGRVDEESIETAREVQRSENFRRRLAEILAERGWLSPADHQTIVGLAREVYQRDTTERLQAFEATLREQPMPLGQAARDPVAILNNSANFSGELLPDMLKVAGQSALGLAVPQLGDGSGDEEEIDGKATINMTLAELAAHDGDEDEDEDKPVDGQATITMTREQMEAEEAEEARAAAAAAASALPPAIGGGGFRLTADALRGLSEDELLANASSRSQARPGPAASALSPIAQGNAELLGDPRVASALGDRYELKRLLGQGAMGKVFLAKSHALGREVAIKFTSSSARNSAEVIARFRREVKVTSLVKHPNVVAVYDQEDLPDGSLFMAMEVLEGPSLEKWLTQQGSLSVTLALGLTEQLTQALKACHDAQVVHRDVKPENITVTIGATGPFLKLVDFGLARLIGQDENESEQVFMSQATQVSGSPRYMAPESVTDSSTVDFRCDIYAIGVTLFEMLAGRVPFDDKNPKKILEHHLYSSVPLLEDVKPGLKVPREIEALVRKMLEKDRDLRFQSCVEVLSALAEARAAVERGANAKKGGFFRSISEFFGRT